MIFGPGNCTYEGLVNAYISILTLSREFNLFGISIKEGRLDGSLCQQSDMIM